MARPPTAAQLRIIRGADPGTGRVRGTESQLAALVRLRFAFRHVRPPHDCFLTPAGHRWREDPAADGGDAVDPVPAGAPPADGVFAARTGGERARPGEDGGERARQVRSAWQGLVEMRRMTHPDATTDRPCAWERTHLIPAAALALEAAGCRPATTDDEGYRVTESAQPEAVAVHAPWPDGLRACADALERAGWQASEHAEPRTRTRYVLASPRRA